MARSSSRDVLSIFTVYLVNISQPVGVAHLVGKLEQSERFSKLGQAKLLEELSGTLTDLVKDGYLRQHANGDYSATYLGIRLLSKRKMAFPRDKHRLYFLKEALRRRG